MGWNGLEWNKRERENHDKISGVKAPICGKSSSRKTSLKSQLGVLTGENGLLLGQRRFIILGRFVELSFCFKYSIDRSKR